MDAINNTRLDDEDYKVPNFLTLLAKYCHESGLPMTMCVKLIKYNSEFGSDEIMVENIFQEAYHKETEKYYPEKHLSKVQLMAFKQEAFMNTMSWTLKRCFSG